MRVGIITNRNLRSPWASTHFYIHRALRRLRVDAVHVARKEIAEHLARQGGRRGGLWSSTTQPAPFTPKITEAIKRDIERGGYDLLLALHASTVVPLLKINCPLVYVTDATAALLNDYYPKRKELLSDQDIDRLEKCEEETIARSDAIVVPTQWAADSVLHDYGADLNRVHTVEWGGNLDSLPDPLEEPRQKDNPVRFLFVGLDWYRKGGDIATEMIESLQSSGVEAKLTVVGSAIPKKNRSPFVRSVGMLNRADPDESAQLDQLFQSADFYIHPARAECYGHVLCEALGFGVPVIATRTGGIPQCVIDGETGLLLPADSPPEEYARRVKELIANEALLSDMRSNAVADFQRRLNWDRWATSIRQIMQELLSPTVSTSPE